MSKFNDTYNKIISEMAEKKLLKECEDKVKEKDELVNEDDMGGEEGGDIGGDEGGEM